MWVARLFERRSGQRVAGGTSRGTRPGPVARPAEGPSRMILPGTRKGEKVMKVKLALSLMVFGLAAAAAWGGDVPAASQESMIQSAIDAVLPGRAGASTNENQPGIRPHAVGDVNEGEAVPAAPIPVGGPRDGGGGPRSTTINHGSFGGAPYAKVDAGAVASFKDQCELIGAGGYASDYEYKTLEATLISFDGNTYVTDRGGCIYIQTVITGLEAGDIVEVDNNYYYDDGTGYSSYWDQAPYWVLISPYTHNSTQTINNWLIYFYDAGDGTYTMVAGSGEYDLAGNTDDLTTIIGDRFQLTREVKVWQGATLISPVVSSRGYTSSTVGVTGGSVTASASLNQTDMKYVGVPEAWVDDDWSGHSNGDLVGGHVFGQDAFAAIQRAIDGAGFAGTINVATGTYAGNILVNKSVTIDGAGQTETTVVPAVSDPGVDDAPSFAGSQVFVVQAHDVTISNLTVDGDNPSLVSSVIRNGVDIDARNGIIEADGPWNNLVVHHCTVRNIYLRGIYARSGGSGFHFHDNTVNNVDGGYSSIAIFNFGGSGVIENNTVDQANDAISANWSRGTQFLNNTVTNSNSGLHTDNNGGSGGAADLIQGNRVSDTATNGYGIWVFFPYVNTVVDRNTVTNADVGFHAWGGMGGVSQFTNNAVDGQARPGSAGVYVTTGVASLGWPYQADVAADFTGNTIKGCAYGVYVEEDTDLALAAIATLSGNDLSGSDVTNAGTYIVNASGNWWGSNVEGTLMVKLSGSVDYTPWLNRGDDQEPGTPGFQGCFDSLWVSAASPQAGAAGRIQEGIDLVSGSTVNVLPGLYAENVNVNKKLTLIGAGSDPAGTVITPAAGSGIVVSASGASASDRLVVQDLRVTGASAHGIEITATNASYLTFDNVACISNGGNGINTNPPVGSASLADWQLLDCDLSSNTGPSSTGLRFPTYVGIDGLTITNGHMNGNVYGLQSYTGASSPLITHVVVSGTTFNDNTSKGMYWESLDNATFTGVTVANSGTVGAWAAGVDINLKYHAFANISFAGCSVTGCGTGDAVNGAGLTIKARDDGSYAGAPATLSNVQISNAVITACQEGIRFGEPGKNNAGPTDVAVHYCTILGNTLKGIRNESLSPTDAESNFWGSGEGPLDADGTYEVSSDDCGGSVAEMKNLAPAGGLGNAVSGNVDYCPWTLGATCTLASADADTCYKVNETVTVNLDLSGATENITGGQWWIEFDETYLTFENAVGQNGWAGYTVVNPPSVPSYPSNVKYVSVMDTTGTGAKDGTMCRLTFKAKESVSTCETTELVRFCDALPGEPPSRLSGVVAEEIYPGLIDLAAITIDNTAPTATQGTMALCYPDAASADAAALSATTDLDDNCGAAGVMKSVQAGAGTCDTSIVIRVTDPCGNYTDYTFNTRVDGTAPTATQGAIASCYPDAASADAAALSATTDLNDDCGATGVSKSIQTGAGTCDTSIVVRVSDSCGNYTDYTYTTRVDGTAPVITAGDDISVNADAPLCTAAVTWPAAAASDDCDDDLGDGVVYDIDLNNNGTIDVTQDGTSYTFPGGTHKVIARATDTCGNTGGDFFMVTVSASNELVTTLALRGGTSGTFQRCITFELDPGAVTVDQVVTFVDGLAGDVSVLVPCGEYECIRARDKLHTLWAKAGLAVNSGNQYIADFTDPDENSLVRGNLNQDEWIDVLDFGIYVVRVGQSMPINVNCGYTARHPDFDGSGDVDGLMDFSFIQTYYLSTDQTCGGKHRDGDETPPVTRIAVADLALYGLEEIAPADLNGDGYIDELDIMAFAEGQLPEPPAPPQKPGSAHPLPPDHNPSGTTPTEPVPPPTKPEKPGHQGPLGTGPGRG